MWGLPDLLHKLRRYNFLGQSISERMKTFGQSSGSRRQKDISSQELDSSAKRERICTICQKRFVDPARVCPSDGSILVAVFSPREDGRIEKIIDNRYEILSLIGKGSTTQVFKARLLNDTDKTAAIKILDLKGIDLNRSRQLQRFNREFTDASRLGHQNIASVFEMGTLPDGRPYLVREYADGNSLEEEITSDGQLPVDRFCSIASQICDALSYAHEQGVFHPDLKPSDIIVCGLESQPDQVLVKLTDFAKGEPWIHSDNRLVQLTEHGDIFGDARYVSPEICHGKPIDARSNVYSLGCILYEMAYGKAPFEGDHCFATALQKLHEPVSFPETTRLDKILESKLRPVISKAIQVDPEQRFQSIAELKTSLLQVVD
jgi:serine/threonine-protein kinase